MSGFRGYNQAGRTSTAKGPMSQRELLVVLRVLIDTSKSKAASRTRDDARRTLRQLMETANWNTPYILRNIGSRRCRYLSGLGYDVPIEATTASGIERLEKLNERHG